MNRVVVIGNSGSGKSTVARRIAEALELEHLELDSVFHRGGWDATPADEFRAAVADHIAAERWVVDGEYASQGMTEVLWPSADTFIWLDLPRWVVMRRVTVRTVRRLVTREELWDGVTEPWTNLYSLDPNKNIMVWAWTRYSSTKDRYEGYLDDGTWNHAKVHRLTSTREVEEFLTSIE